MTAGGKINGSPSTQGTRGTAQGTRGTTAGGKIDGSPTNDGSEHSPFCSSDRKEEEAEDPKNSFWWKRMQAVDLHKVSFWSIAYPEYVGRKSIMLTMVTQGKSLFLGCWELVDRQQLIQECALGEAGLRHQAQPEELAILFERLVSTEQVRRQMIVFCLQPRPGASADNVNSYIGANHATSDWVRQPNPPK